MLYFCAYEIYRKEDSKELVTKGCCPVVTSRQLKSEEDFSEICDEVFTGLSCKLSLNKDECVMIFTAFNQL